MQSRQFLSQITDTGDESGFLLSTHRKRYNKPPRRAERQHTWEAFLISMENLMPANQSQPENHSVHTDSLEDRARSPHRETSGRSRSCRTYQEPPSEKHPESPKSSPQYIRCAAIGLCCGLFCAAPA